MATTERTYQVRFLRYAYRNFDQFHPAQWVTWTITAPNEKEALLRIKSKVRRAEQFYVLNPD